MTIFRTRDSDKRSYGIYQLPFPLSLPIKIQASPESHTGIHRHAVDFLVLEDTPVLCPRDGKVFEVKQDSNLGGPDSRYADDANFIILDHGDGETSILIHLAQDSVVVTEGQFVKQGQVIAKQGSTGWTTEPHIHMAVYQLCNSVCIRWAKKAWFKRVLSK